MSTGVLDLDRHEPLQPATEPEWRRVAVPAEQRFSAEDEDFIAMIDFLSDNWETPVSDD